MKKILFLALFSLFFLGKINAQDKKIAVEILDTKILLSDKWIGEWNGEMKVIGVPKIDKVTVKIIIKGEKNASKWVWSLQYGGQAAREYELLGKDTQKGKYIIDEKNSILLETYFSQDVITSVFEVEGNQIISVYRLENDTLIFENTTIKPAKVLKTGAGDKDTPEVKIYPVAGFQRAVLKKNK